MKKRTLKTGKKNDFTYCLPAIRAVQAGQEYFTTAIPFCVLAKLLSDRPALGFVDRDRSKSIGKFITCNAESYVLPAITISIGGKHVFEGIHLDCSGVAIGTLVLEMDAEIVIHDGNYRAMGIIQALGDRPSLGDESISVVIFPDSSGQGRKFGEIKAHQRKSGRAERIVRDMTDAIANITREVIANVAAFTDSIELLKTTISNRSKNLFTFSSLYQANEILLAGYRDQPIEKQVNHAVEFWKTIQNAMPDWTSKIPRVELRKQTIHAHGVTLCAIAFAGALTIKRYPTSWRQKIAKLKEINWRREEIQLWEGKAMLGGRMTKSAASVELTAQVILGQIGVDSSKK